MKLFRVGITRPSKPDEQDRWKLFRDCYVTGDSFDAATKAAVDYYNDLDDVDDYYVREVSIEASDSEDESSVLIQA